MIKNYNLSEVLTQCEKMWYGANDQYVTGWNNWPCKQDLYRVKFAVDEMLRTTANFADESQWVARELQEQEKKRVWQALNAVQHMR